MRSVGFLFVRIRFNIYDIFYFINLFVIYVVIRYSIANLAWFDYILVPFSSFNSKYIFQEWEKEDKLAKLLEEISSDSSAKVLIFAETKKKCDELTRVMRKYGYSAMAIHGDKKQEERDWVLSQFRSGSTSILVATDVAARGLGRITSTTSCDRYYYIANLALIFHNAKILFVSTTICQRNQ